MVIIITIIACSLLAERVVSAHIRHNTCDMTMSDQPTDRRLFCHVSRCHAETTHLNHMMCGQLVKLIRTTMAQRGAE